MTTSYEPPADIWEVNANLQLDEPLEGENDPRWVNTQSARGENSLLQLGQALGVDMSKRQLQKSPERGYYLFCGHRGSGKSTELRRIRNDLGAPGIYYVVFADAAQELDVNNLRYQDILLHLAGKLMGRLEEDGVMIEPVHLRKLQDWFTERVEMQAETEDFAQEIKAGVQAEAGIPGLVKLFAGISNALKTNSTYKKELRRTLQNHFTDFSESFNHLIMAAEDAIHAAGKSRRILFVIDGTDRLSGDDAKAFFISDVHQLQQVHGRFVYCAPVHLAYEGSTIRQNFNRIFQLPMIKIANQDGTINQLGREVMREMLHKRAAPDLFDDGVADILVEYSGGHPRDLLRLLHSTFIYTEHGRFDVASARRAVREAATDFRRFLHPIETEPEEIEGLGDGQAASWGDYPIDTLLIRNETRTVHDVLRRIEREAFVMDPDFQRDFIWDPDKQSRLIESVVMRIPLPVFYLAEDDRERLVVVDGLQRLTTFQRFVNNELQLRLEDRPELNRKKFEDLTPKLQNRVEDCNLILYVIDAKVPEQARLDIFERVNGGVPLSRQQMRNCLYMGDATRFLKDESRTGAFLKATGGSLRTSTMRDREFVNRFCAFQILGLEKYRDMDNFLAAGLRAMNARPESLSALSSQFRTTLDNNFSLFGRHAFRKHEPGQDRRSVLNASLWDVMSTGFSHYPREVVKENAAVAREAFYRLMGNEEFVDAITRGPNSANQVRRRFAMAREMFEDVFGAYPA